MRKFYMRKMDHHAPKNAVWRDIKIELESIESVQCPCCGNRRWGISTGTIYSEEAFIMVCHDCVEAFWIGCRE